MAAHRIWPGTPEERKDRERVVELVQRVGRQRLRFTVYDLQRAMRAEPELMLARATLLSRHVHDLGRSLVRPAERRLSTTMPSEDGAPLPVPSKARHTWVLTERWAEYSQSGPVLDDLEKTLCALWVAYIAAGEDVTTRAVTDVLQSIEELAPDRAEQTSLRLSTLSTRADALAQRLPRGTERWVRWRPMGAKPEHPLLDRWVEVVSGLNAGGRHVVGHATLAEAVRELVVIAIRATRSPDWPAGRPVKIDDVRAQADVEPRATWLLQRIERSGGSLHTALGDLAKTRIDGRSRVRTRVTRLARRIGERCYYEVPDEPGAESRHLYMLVEDLRFGTSKLLLESLKREWSAAQRLLSSGEPALRAIASARVLSCWEEVSQVEVLLKDLEKHLPALSTQTRQLVQARIAAYEAVVHRWGTRDGADAAAAEALAPFGLSAIDVLSAPRPLLTANELRAFLPVSRRGKGSDAHFFARIPALRRFLNPEYRDRGLAEPRQAAVTCADRVEGLVYLAEQSGAKTLAFLRQGASVLGRSYRSPTLLVRLLESPDREGRIAALAGLALLGDPAGTTAAQSWLARTDLSPVEIECSLHALLVLQNVCPGEAPAGVRRSSALAVQKAWREVALAARQGRWLL